MDLEIVDCGPAQSRAIERSRRQSLGPIGDVGVGAGERGIGPGGGSIFQAVQSLGLRLDAQKSPIEVVIVVRVEKNPTE